MIKNIKEDLKKALEHNRRAEDFIEKANAQLSILEDTEEDPKPEPAVTDISVKTEPHKIIISLKSEEELDIRYQFIPERLKEGEINPEKVHSVVGYIKDVDEDKPIKIWIGRRGTWEVQIVSLDSDYKSEIYTVKVPDAEVIEPTPNPDPVPDPIPEPAPEGVEKITVFENKKENHHTPVPNGIVEYEGKWRMFFWDRANEEMLYSDSEDLESWSKPRTASIQERGMYMQKEDGEVLFYKEGNDSYLEIYKVDKHFTRLYAGFTAYQWRIDGMLSLHQFNGTYYSTGRVRGQGSNSIGRWEGYPEYPKLKDLPFIKQEFDKHLPSWANPDAVIKDRRGMSLHKSNDLQNWNHYIVADPADFSQTEFKGWNTSSGNGIADFYASTLVDPKRVIVKLYKKEKRRVIDRWDYRPDMDIRRRFRFTGETILVPGIIKDNKLQLVSTGSIIPREWFERKTPSSIDYASAPNRKEVGQLNATNRVIQKGDYVYVPFGYRDDVHYEGYGWNYKTGIYIAKYPKKMFDKHFK